MGRSLLIASVLLVICAGPVVNQRRQIACIADSLLARIKRAQPTAKLQHSRQRRPLAGAVDLRIAVLLLTPSL
jgi:hypothetical protein